MPSLFIIGLSLSVFWFKAMVISRAVILIVREWKAALPGKRSMF